MGRDTSPVLTKYYLCLTAGPTQLDPKMRKNGVRILVSGFSRAMHSDAYVCELLLAEARQHLPPSAARALSASATPLAEAAAARELQVGRAALASVREEAAAVGQQLLPLRSPAELAILLQVELLYPLGTPLLYYHLLRRNKGSIDRLQVNQQLRVEILEEVRVAHNYEAGRVAKSARPGVPRGAAVLADAGSAVARGRVSPTLLRCQRSHPNGCW